MFDVLFFYAGEDEPFTNIKATKIFFSSENGPRLDSDFIIYNASNEECSKIKLTSNFCLYLDGVGYRVKCTGIESTFNNDYSLLIEISFVGFGDKCTCENHIAYMQNYKNVVPEIIEDPKEISDKVSNKFELLDL